MSWLAEMRRRELQAALAGRDEWRRFVAECESVLQVPWRVIVEWFNELDRAEGKR